MTLLIGACNSKYAVVVADTRISSNGRLIDDASPKIVSFRFYDGQLLGSYTGLAYSGNYNTRRWLLGAVHDFTKPWNKAQEALSNIRARLSEEFKSNADLQKLDEAGRRLSILFTGWADGIVLGALISNFEDHNGLFKNVVDDFVLTRWTARAPDSTFVGVYGARQVVSIESVLELQDLLRTQDSDPTAVKGKMHALILRGSKEAKSNGVVGSNILTGTLPINDWASSWYSSEGAADKILTVDVFNAVREVSVMDLTFSAPGLVTPRSKRRGKGGMHRP